MIQNIPEKTFIDPRVEIRKSGIEGDGLYTIAPIKKGEIVIHRGGGEIVTDDEFQKGFKEGIYQAESAIHFDENHKWVSLASEPDYADAAINHSCNPNLWFENGWPLVAIRDIEKGEELTFDYATGETYPLQGECNCKSEMCRKHISGEERKDPEFQKRYKNHFNPYIQGLIDKEMMKKKPIIISAWICSGKTYLTKNYKEIIELPSGAYKYILTDEQKAVKNKEALKSTKREINPEWPINYYDAIIQESKNNKHDIILIAPCMPFEEMRAYGIDFLLAYPDPICKEEYMSRARNRGANEEFVERVANSIQTDFEDFLKQPNEKIILEPGEYLEDALIRIGILKKKGQI